MQQQPNSTTLVRAGINIFIALAIGVSLYQELNFLSGNAQSNTQTTPAQKVPQVNVNGTKVEGLAILSTDKFKKNFTDLLVEKDYNIQIKDYPFEDTEYWVDLFLTHGHMLVVFLLVSRYQAEQQQSKKMKIMLFGMVLVFGWMFLAPGLKTQRVGLQYKGVRVYQRDDFVKEQIEKKIVAYEEDSIFDLEPVPQEVSRAQSSGKQEVQSVPETFVDVQEEPLNDF